MPTGPRLYTVVSKGARAFTSAPTTNTCEGGVPLIDPEIEQELASMRERIADDGLRIVELTEDVTRLSRIVELLTENGDVIATGLQRHQMHHEAVEELLDKPITRAMVERMLRDISTRDEAERRATREAHTRVINEQVQ